ncbi:MULTISPECIES: SMI1/KNR4 family protein [unclassified Microcoleus]|uniref:SMI1/KNR4 family protein n=1 Tax=unclassified Microcoleus TaxID=2642155 RepID=UPI002FD4D585
MKQLFQPRNPLVRTFAQSLKRYCPDAQNLLNSGAIETEIDLFKNRYQQSLPETFYDFYRWYNGSVYESSENKWLLPFEHGRSILSLASIVNEKKFWDTQSLVNFQQWRPGEYWNKAWIPFMKVDDLWLRVVDTKGCFDGVPGQIISFDCKNEPFRSIECDSFDKWLETVIAKIELECLFKEFHEIGLEEEKAIFAIDKRINPNRHSVELELRKT